MSEEGPTLSRPRVTLKAGTTLDGRISSEHGESRWITGAEARRVGHALRAQHDAILVGTGTLLADDPSLNTRMVEGRDPVPVVLDRLGRCPKGAKVLTAGRRPLFFTARPERLAHLPVDIEVVPERDSKLDLVSVLSAMVKRGLDSVLVEGGGQVHRSLLDLDVVDRIELFIALKVLAGGPGWVGGPGYRLALAPRFSLQGVQALGEDVQLSLMRAEA